MERWVLLRKGADFKRIGEKFHISPRLACLIRNRDIVGDEAVHDYLCGTVADLHDGMLMRDMGKAVALLTEKIECGNKIRVIGDYDIDGVNEMCIRDRYMIVVKHGSIKMEWRGLYGFL